MGGKRCFSLTSVESGLCEPLRKSLTPWVIPDMLIDGFGLGKEREER